MGEAMSVIEWVLLASMIFVAVGLVLEASQ